MPARTGEKASRGSALLAACKLYLKTSGKGGRYLAGRLGGLRVLVMPKRDGEEGEHSHLLLIGEATQRGAATGGDA